jgi:multidrug efflux pump subunit AcrA (membrane-fusion protein)
MSKPKTDLSSTKALLVDAQERLISTAAELLAARDARRTAEIAAREAREAAAKEVAQVRAQFDDLKRRVQDAETSNQFMRGYIARVQEDDTVREELVTMGEPDGEQQLVPKRKPTPFPRPSDFTQLEPSDAYGISYDERQERKRKARHWITY